MENTDVGALLEREFHSDHFLRKCHDLKKTTRYLTNKKCKLEKMTQKLLPKEVIKS